MPQPILNLPNILTLSRIFAIPVFLAIAFWPPIPINDPNHISFRHALLTSLFVLASFTDWVDGFLARKLNQSSPFGEFLDPVADKLMVAASLIVLVQWHQNTVMAISAVVIISREILVSALREWMAEIGQRKQVSVAFIGKIKTTLQLIAISGLLLNYGPLMQLAYVFLLIAVVLTLWSMIIYARAAWPYFKSVVR